MIKSIKLDNCVPYKQALISDCKKINYIFGTNGSGKSTISSFLSGSKDSRFSTSLIEWTNTSHETIEVYDKKFREANLKNEMPGIFTLGSNTIADIETVKDLKNKLDQLNKDYDSLCKIYDEKNDEKKQIEQEFKEDSWTKILKKMKKSFKKPLKDFEITKTTSLMN